MQPALASWLPSAPAPVIVGSSPGKGGANEPPTSSSTGCDAIGHYPWGDASAHYPSRDQAQYVAARECAGICRRGEPDGANPRSDHGPQLLGSPALAGLATSILGGCRFLVAYPAGHVADTYGRRTGLL